MTVKALVQLMISLIALSTLPSPQLGRQVLG